ncbi:IS3 family transposase [Hymenobacter crusticola]|uniref:IS3 family transposase n=1 Tax=Hymenobacter crusticola TaxID=1770526 RepID=UPI0015C4FE9C|nr:IS3 family transposase [Hymenobacter crusticola]
MKTELLPHGGAFASLEEAQLEVASYLDTYFNLDRRHSALDYRPRTNLKPTCSITYLTSVSVSARPTQAAACTGVYVAAGCSRVE